MTSYEHLTYFHLIKFWNIHNLVTILDFFNGAFYILFLSLLAFQSRSLKKFFEGSQDL